jgi:hypothetical protein
LRTRERYGGNDVDRRFGKLFFSKIDKTEWVNRLIAPDLQHLPAAGDDSLAGREDCRSNWLSGSN